MVGFLNMRRIFVSWLVGMVACAVGLGHAQEYEGVTLVEAELIAAKNAVVPGESLEIGLRLRMAPGWHTYWEFPGDSGIPTQIAWELPDGFGAGPIEWPIPKAKLEPGDIEVYAYTDEVVLIVPIQVPADLEPGGEVTLRGDASWLVCEAICIPGSAEVAITLPVAASAEPTNEEEFATWRARIPSPEAPPFSLAWRAGDGVLTGTLESETPVANVRFFPLPDMTQSVGHPAVEGPDGDGQFVIRVNASAPLRGVVAVERDGADAAWFVVADAEGGGAPAAATGGGAGLETPPLWQALLFGFLGGMILNLMPCVLPVISLKIFGFIRQAGDEPRRIMLHGLSFSAGIFLWFLGLGALIAILKAAGAEVTWAFQFQNPMFILVIAAVVFVFALNLMGVFELTLPGRAVGAMSDAGAREGYSGSFFQGIFATLLATPCTGPFLGTALGFAFAQPAIVIFAMFGSVALGMAAPYLLLSARPGWMRFLPKPGVWMEKLKQFMAFPLFATLIWLFSILGGQKGLAGVIWGASFLLALGLAVWIYGAFCGPMSKPGGRAAALVVAILCVLGGSWFFVGQGFAKAGPPEQSGVAQSDGIDWQPFSQALVDDLIAEGKPVFIDFTADWCITCKFNERTAINTPAVRAEIERQGIVPVMADWTNSNPEITAALREFGRVGVPFYVLYPAGRADEPITLPELLTERMVIDAFQKAR